MKGDSEVGRRLKTAQKKFYKSKKCEKTYNRRILSDTYGWFMLWLNLQIGSLINFFLSLE